ncbi:iron ABC transporter permease [Conexibacter sp. JD483]|uniref:FecCD family ABC transporter permease n=1 Tax=unclassified Conexibacter TaxID=2627773 RepID=UPI00271C361F|nr:MULTISPECIES: iron ABC transporter permease [unclassified Conexibacter]MDO8185428.1 iron ABC transporter permease [Conexibacter sp. CPCC 205706]MDO8198396.1 iron ABC transporter permease [Conexibacter sp. CPCC 205762]MDR9369358.1 iron ABC transporter permease [Conexibacter sp. JD483]
MSLRQILVALFAVVALVAAAIGSIAFGAVHVPISDVIDALTGQGKDGPLKQIILDLRLPRMVEAILVGAALGVAGTLLQGALANPLASPDVMGVTGGASFGAILILIVFPAQIALLPIGALVCGMLAAGLVFVIGATGTGGGSAARLILAGIAMTAAFQAGTTSLMASFPDRVPGAIFWLAGGLTTAGWENVKVTWPYLALGFFLAIMLARPLDRLSLGDDVAASLGSRPRAIRLTAAIAAAMLAACAAAIAGLVTFLGLFIPHVVRMASGTSSNAYIVPVSALAGAALMLVGDTLARVVAAPIELPVGPLMVLLGVPLFLYLLRRQT